MQTYRRLYRPGYFGRKRDLIVANLNARYGEDGWELRWVTSTYPNGLTFKDACIEFYEYSYESYFVEHPEELDIICAYGECIDNAMTNIQSGCDYEHQESYSTHIQDIAVRNVLFKFGREFEGPADKILVIRSADSNGYKFGPGNIPFWAPAMITQPPLCPKWANKWSVEEFWQSNKWIFVLE